MILADAALARRIENAEARLSGAIAGVASSANLGPGAFAIDLRDGVAVFAGPGSPANKIIGIGLDSLPDEILLNEVEKAFFSRSSCVQAEISTLALPSVHELFTRRGYLLLGFENVLGRILTGDDAREEPVPGAPSVYPVPESELALWMDTVITGFEHPDLSGAGSASPMPDRQAIEQAFIQAARTEGYRAYLARSGDEIAGGAGLRIDQGVAQLCGASTLPQCRRRGVQGALLSRRLKDARLAGCDFAVLTAQPGSKSHFNAQRQGFSLLYPRAILVKTPPA
jgi:hypothetical protein